MQTDSNKIKNMFFCDILAAAVYVNCENGNKESRRILSQNKKKSNKVVVRGHKIPEWREVQLFFLENFWQFEREG